MANDLNQSLYVGDEIDLMRLFKILIESKIIIISTILIFTVSSIIYSLSLKPSFIASTNLEIGYVELENGDRELIESPSELISDLKILLMKNPDDKFKQNLSMNSFEKKIISLKTTSSSAEQNENLLTEIISYINERHSNLRLLKINQKKDEISHNIKIIESEISFYKSQNLYNLANIELEISFYKSQNLYNLANIELELSTLKEALQVDLEAKVSNLEAKILKIQGDLPILDQEINQLNQVVIEDSNNLKLLKSTSLSVERAANSPTLEQIISSYKSQINQLRRERNSSISELSILSQKLEALKENSLQSGELLKLEERKKDLENFASQSDELLKLEERKKDLENFASQSDEFFKLEQTLKNNENQLQMLMSQNTTQTSPIKDIRIETIKPKTQRTISLGIIFGFFAGILLVFINSFIKEYRKSKV
ncbi:Wzz/FepE/Etk N-terminal domain-containing protein [Candidatus Thioglobus sp.]|nr:Wzz/FepE/Etk N-terminal domain-containing protein [Candidatus Thioglobus sp.]